MGIQPPSIKNSKVSYQNFKDLLSYLDIHKMPMQSKEGMNSLVENSPRDLDLAYLT